MLSAALQGVAHSLGTLCNSQVGSRHSSRPSPPFLKLTPQTTTPVSSLLRSLTTKDQRATGRVRSRVVRGVLSSRTRTEQQLLWQAATTLCRRGNCTSMGATGSCRSLGGATSPRSGLSGTMRLDSTLPSRCALEPCQLPARLSCMAAKICSLQCAQVQKSAKHYTEAARDEIQLLSEIRDGVAGPRQQYCVQLRDSFEHSGPHGTHMCMVFEVRQLSDWSRVLALLAPWLQATVSLQAPHTSTCCPLQVLGDNLLALIKAYNYRGIPLHLVKRITQQACPGSHVPSCPAPEQVG